MRVKLDAWLDCVGPNNFGILGADCFLDWVPETGLLCQIGSCGCSSSGSSRMQLRGVGCENAGAGKPLAMSSCCETLGYRNDSILLSNLAGRGKPLECRTDDAFGNVGRETGLDVDKMSAT